MLVGTKGHPYLPKDQTMNNCVAQTQLNNVVKKDQTDLF